MVGKIVDTSRDQGRDYALVGKGAKLVGALSFGRMHNGLRIFFSMNLNATFVSDFVSKLKLCSHFEVLLGLLK